MAPPRMRVTGTREVAGALEGIADDVRAMDDANRRIADELRPLIAARTRRRSGRLASSWRAAGTATAGLIENDTLYAGPQEYGWPARNIEPTGAVASVIDAQREHIRELYELELTKTIRARGMLK